jgi:hypothetical protein
MHLPIRVSSSWATSKINHLSVNLTNIHRSMPDRGYICPPTPLVNVIKTVGQGLAPFHMGRQIHEISVEEPLLASKACQMEGKFPVNNQGRYTVLIDLAKFPASVAAFTACAGLAV